MPVSCKQLKSVTKIPTTPTEKVTKKMAATAAMEVTWEDVLSCIDNLLMETEIQDNNSDLGFHEAALVLNRLDRNGGICPTCNS